MKLVCSDEAWEDYLYWAKSDEKIAEKLSGRIHELINQCTRTPLKGKGKPEALKGDLSGWWSRRITQSDRIVYRVIGSGEAQSLEIAQLRYHY